MLDDHIPPMLAYAAEPFDSIRHLYEVKWDGTRCLLFLKEQGLRLQNRRLQDITRRYPELANLGRELRARNVILDGELVVFEGGRPDFGKLQQREHAVDPFKIGLLARQLPAVYVTFDLLYLNDDIKVALPLRARKELLARVLTESPRLLESRYILTQGKAFFREVVAQGLEGVMAKALTSPYLIGKRSRHWLKIKPKPRAVAAIIGYTPGAGARADSFGALLLATRGPEGWIYRGKVGSGFAVADLANLTARLQRLETSGPPAPLRIRTPGIRWVKPELTCEIRFQETTPHGHYRAPVFERLVT